MARPILMYRSIIETNTEEGPGTNVGRAFYLFWFGALLVLALAGIPSPVASQSVAWTTCRGDVVASFVNTGVLDSDSTEEILTHEAKHRAQARAMIDSLGACPFLEDGQRLKIEAEAYCVSDSVRVRVKRTSAWEAKAISLWRLLSQFHPTISADTVLTVWRSVCP